MKYSRLLEVMTFLNEGDISTIVSNMSPDQVIELMEEAELFDILNELTPSTAAQTMPQVSGGRAPSNRRRQNNKNGNDNNGEGEEEKTEEEKAREAEEKKKIEEEKARVAAEKARQEAEEAERQRREAEAQEQEPEPVGPGAGAVALNVANQAMYNPYVATSVMTGIGNTISAGARGVGSAVRAGGSYARQNPVGAAVAVGAVALTAGLAYLFKKYFGDYAQKKLTAMKNKCDQTQDPVEKIKCEIQVAQYSLQMVNRTMSKTTDEGERKRLAKEREKYNKAISKLQEKWVVERRKQTEVRQKQRTGNVS